MTTLICRWRRPRGRGVVVGVEEVHVIPGGVASASHTRIAARIAADEVAVGYRRRPTPGRPAAIDYSVVGPPDTLWPASPCTNNDATVMMGQQEGCRHASF